MPKCKLDIQQGIVESAIKMVATPTIKSIGNSRLFINNVDYTKQQAFKVANSITNKINKAFGEDIAFREQKTDGQEIKIVPSEQLVENYFRAYNEKWNINHQKIYGINSFGDSSPVYYREGEVPFDLEQANKDDANAIANELANTLAIKTGFNYNNITPEEAIKINPKWKGETAFFNGETVYFVGNNLRPDIVLHEYSHPLLRAISKENPELFNKLYNKLLTSPEASQLQKELSDLYPELDSTSDLYKEEILVRALTRAATKENSTDFMSAIKEILYQIKQLLRRVFGKEVNVSKLDQNTSLEELAIMLKGDYFKIDRTKITQEDINVYMREQKETADIALLDEKVRVLLSNELLEVATKHIRSLKTVKQYEDMLRAIKDPLGRNKLQDIIRNLTDYKELTDEDIVKLADNLDWVKAQSQDLVSSILRLQNVTIDIKQHIEKINQSPESKDNLQKVSYYLGVINYWKPFLSTVDNQFRSILPSTAPIRALISAIDKNLQDAKKEIIEIQVKGTLDAFRVVLQPSIDAIDNMHKETLDKINASNAKFEFKKELLDKENKQYEKDRLSTYKNSKGETVDPIKDYLKGERGDAGALGSFIQGIISNPDPIIGGFGLIIKNAMTDVMVSLQRKQNDFIREISPLAKKAGIDPNNVSDSGEGIIFLDKVGRVENGEFVQKEEYTFLNLFKDTELHLNALYFELNQAQAKANETKSDADYKIAAEINRAIDKHKQLYWNQEYVASFYDNDNMFDSEIGKEAYLDKQLVLAKIRDLQNTIDDEYTDSTTSDLLKEAWREYQQLFSILDRFGIKKTGTSLEKALLLKRHREHTKQYYKWTEYPGAFQSALTNYEQKLINQYPEKGIEYDKKRQEWIDDNTATKIKDIFYAEIQLRYNMIKELKDTLPKDANLSANIDEALTTIRESLIGYRDEDNQPNATEMRPERIAEVKKAQLELIKFQDQLAKLSGLTGDEIREVSEIFDNIKEDKPANRVRLKELMDKKTKLGLSDFKKKQILNLYNQLDKLQSKTSTSYYADIVNNYLSNELKVVPDLFLNTQSRSITPETADEILKPENLNPLLEKSSKFKEWFENNHIKKNKFNYETKENEEVWERLNVWNITKPRDDKYYEHTDIRDDNGNVVETIKGIPSLKYFKREVDNVWKTEKKEGVTVDNKGKWLPKTMEERTIKENVPVKIGNYEFIQNYHNTAYEELKKNDPNKFNYLEALKKQHLDIQKQLRENKDKLGLRIARYRKRGLERIQAKGVGIIEDIKSQFQHREDDYETGMNMKTTTEKATLELFDNELSDVPITGLYKLDPDQVSLDVIAGTLRYMASAERQTKLLELAPTAQALRTILKDPEAGIKKVTEMNKQGRLNRIIKWVSNTRQESVRSKAIDNQIKRTFEGENNTGLLSDSKVANEISSLMFKGATAALFSLNIPSALKNSFSAMFQNMILSAAGQDSTLATYHKGIAWSVKESIELSSQLYTHKTKSLYQQLINVFDAVPMHQEHSFANVMSRTLFKDTVNFSWMIAPRRFTEINATLGLFGSMMYHQKVPRIIDGKEQLIDYMDAFELVNDQIVLKSGIDQSWAPGGSKYKIFKNNYDAHTSDLNGGFTEFDQPEATRHLVARMIMYMRKYFVTMFQNRWGVHRLAVGHSAMTEGYYITTLKALGNTFSTLAKHGQWYGQFASQREKTAALKMAVEMAQLAIISLISSMFFGWSPDDKDKYKKLREKSGPLPLLGIRDTDNPFDLLGWTSNHTLLLTQNVFNENAQWITPSGYLQNMLDFKSVAIGPTLALYSKILKDSYQMATGNENAYYKKSIGPYEWQDKGSAKILNHIGHIGGLTAGTVDPALAIQNLQAITSKN